MSIQIDVTDTTKKLDNIKNIQSSLDETEKRKVKLQLSVWRLSPGFLLYLPRYR